MWYSVFPFLSFTNFLRRSLAPISTCMTREVAQKIADLRLASFDPTQKTSEPSSMDVDIARLRISECSFQEEVHFLSVCYVGKGVDHLVVCVVGADRENRAEENLRWLILRVELFALIRVYKDRARCPIGSLR